MTQQSAQVPRTITKWYCPLHGVTQNVVGMGGDRPALCANGPRGGERCARECERLTYVLAKTGEQPCSTCKGDMVVPDPDNPVVGNLCPDCTTASSREKKP